MAELASEPEAKGPAPAEPGAESPKNGNDYYLAWFNTLYHRRWHIVATQTREPASRSVPCTKCAVIGIFARHLLETFQRCRTRSL